MINSIWRQGQLILGMIFVGLCLLVALLAPRLSPPANPESPEMFIKVGRISDMTPHPPNEKARLGTLPGQFDVFHTLVWGTREAFSFGLLVVLICCAFGTFYGALSGYLGGWADQALMRIADALMAFPAIAAVVFISQIISILLVQSGGYPVRGEWYFEKDVSPLQQFLLQLDPILIALILLSWMPYARLVNTNVISLKKLEFITAARALGAGKLWILYRHLLPNGIAPVLVLAARDVGAVVVLQTTFTFIGLGSSTPWGEMLNIGRNWIVGVAGNPFIYWWTFLPTTAALLFFSIGWNFIGDGLTDWLSSRRR